MHQTAIDLEAEENNFWKSNLGDSGLGVSGQTRQYQEDKNLVEAMLSLSSYQLSPTLSPCWLGVWFSQTVACSLLFHIIAAENKAVW